MTVNTVKLTLTLIKQISKDLQKKIEQSLLPPPSLSKNCYGELFSIIKMISSPYLPRPFKAENLNKKMIRLIHIVEGSSQNPVAACAHLSEINKAAMFFICSRKDSEKLR